jgi:hypothetical protein
MTNANTSNETLSALLADIETTKSDWYRGNIGTGGLEQSFITICRWADEAVEMEDMTADECETLRTAVRTASAEVQAFRGA